MSDQSVLDTVRVGRSRGKRVFLIIAIVFVAMIAAYAIAIRFVAGSGPKEVKSIPSNFPSIFVLYRPEEVQNIVYYPASEKQKPLQFALLPIQWLSGSSSEAKKLAENVQKGTGAIGKTDTVSLTWLNMNAKVDDILRFYAGSLRQAGIDSPQVRQTPEKDVTEIKGDADTFSADILIVAHPASSMIDSVTVIVEYPGK
ncbi:MAG: hypothetical protein WC477_00490 [Patescibacteria group bacterium]